MNAIETLYRNTGLVTEDGYVKVRDGLWIKSGPYKKQTWDDADKSILPTKEELHEIYLKFWDIVAIQESCKLESLPSGERNEYWWTFTHYDEDLDRKAWIVNMDNYYPFFADKSFDGLIVPIRRSP